MKTPNYIVRIPEPCHEDWNKMTPDDKGRFCSSCSKTVVDFSNKTDSEIRDILLESQGTKVCGHFRKSQIDRPLNITIDLNNLPKNMSITKIFTIALFLVFGTFLFSCTDMNGKKIDGIEVRGARDKENIVGAMDLTLPELVKGSTIAEPDTLTQQVIIEQMVNGGIRAEQVIPQDNIMVDGEIKMEDSTHVVPERYYMLGAVAIVDNIPGDSAQVQKPDSILPIEKIGNTGTFLNNAKELTVFPNPTSGDFTLKYEVTKRGDVRVDVLDMNGMFLKNLVNVAGQYEGRYNIPVTLNEFSAGTYFISLLNNGKRSTEKVVIVK